MTVTNFAELKALTLAQGAQCRAVDNLDDLLTLAVREVETVIGAPWTPTERTETLIGDDTPRLQLKTERVTELTSVMSGDDEWFCHLDHAGGLVRPACYTWPAGKHFTAAFTAGFDGSKRTTIAGVIAAVAAAKAEQCATGKRSETIGSYSVTYHDGRTVVGDISDRHYRLLRQCAR